MYITRCAATMSLAHRSRSRARALSVPTETERGFPVATQIPAARRIHDMLHHGPSRLLARTMSTCAKTSAIPLVDFTRYRPENGSTCGHNAPVERDFVQACTSVGFVFVKGLSVTPQDSLNVLAGIVAISRGIVVRAAGHLAIVCFAALAHPQCAAAAKELFQLDSQVLAACGTESGRKGWCYARAVLRRVVLAAPAGSCW